MLFQTSSMRLETSEGIATLWLDGEDDNRLSLAVLRDLRAALAAARGCPGIEVMLLRSGRPGVFSLGADRAEYAALADAESRRAYARAGADAFASLEAYSDRVPTVALIDGECRDAGLELALACRHRLAVARPEALLGFEYLAEGMMPCWGVTQRLPRRIGPKHALDLLLHQRLIPARMARQIGLVDHAFGRRAAKTETWWFLDQARRGQRGPSRRPLRARLFEHPWLADRSLFRPALHRLPRHDPARAIVAAMRRGWRLGEAEGLAAERQAFVERGLAPEHSWRRIQAGYRRQLAERWRDIACPDTVGLLNLEGRALHWAVAAFAAGTSVIVREAAPGPRLEREVCRAVDDGWLTILEAERQLDRLKVRAGEAALNQCGLVVLTGSDARQTAELLELDRRLEAEAVLLVTAPGVALGGLAGRLQFPERVVKLDAGATCFTLQPTRWTEERATARAFRWLQRCGERVTVAAAEESRYELSAA